VRNVGALSALLDKIESLSVYQLKEIGAEAARAVSSLYSWDASTQKLESLYLENLKLPQKMN
jgi:glycosyltransferase involved in cell wall biosynthesis